MFIKKFRSQLIVGSVFLFPILFYVLLSIGKHGYTRLAYYGPNQAQMKMEQAYELDSGSFVNQNADTLFIKDNRHKISVWSLINTNDYLLTPSVIANLQFLQDRFKDRSELQFFSLVSNEVSDGDIQAFIQKLNIETHNWQVLHADSVRINQFAQNQLFLKYKQLPDSLNQVVPTVQLVLVDQNLRIRGYFDGATHKEVKEELLDAIDMLIREQFVIYKDKSKIKKGI
jgi:protein SCO1/2